MLQELILLIDSVELGKKVVFQIPCHFSRLKVDNRNIKPSQFVSRFLQSCSHFGIVNSQNIALDLPEEVFMNYFFPNQKYQEVCMSIEDSIVVARSAFFSHKTVIAGQKTPKSTELPINSINLIGITNRYENIETIKQLLGFMVNVLVYEQNCMDMLSQQLKQVIKEKELFISQVKEIPSKLQGQSSEIKDRLIECCIQNIKQISNSRINNIELFTTIKNLFLCANHGKTFEYSDILQINTNIKCTQFKLPQNILYKTLLFSTKKVRDHFGNSQSKRLENILTTISNHPNRSLQEIGVEYRISEEQLKNVAGLILGNSLGMLISPILPFNKYSLCMNNRHPISNFNELYKQSYIQVIKNMERTGEVQNANHVPFLLLNGIVRQSNLYVFCPRKGVSLNPLKHILSSYALKGVPITEIARLEEVDLKSLVRFIVQNPTEIALYAVQ